MNYIDYIINCPIDLDSMEWKQCTEAMNQDAQYFLNKKDLTENEVERLSALLQICNILYNRTEITILPIEDGVYDLLLEKYKFYDPNFQVGCSMLDIKVVKKDNKVFTENKPAIRFFDEDITDGFYYNDIYRAIPITRQDLLQSPIHFFGDISKRTHSVEHNHPNLIGTLDKCKFVLMADAIDKGVADDPNVKVLERDFFQAHIEQGILDPNRRIKMVLELKYDGISVEADCTNVVLSARSRGDTGIGVASDMTPILNNYLFKHAGEFRSQKPIGIKFEAIMTYPDLARFNYMKNYSYKNCRTAIIGLFGSSDAWKYRDLITLIPLEIDRSDIPEVEWNRQLEIEFLNKYFISSGQPLRYAIIEGDYKYCLFMIKKFLEETEVARGYLPFMYDGIVVSYMDEDIRQSLGRKNHINKYSMAVKYNPLKKQTIFRGYSYTIGQGGQVTPMIHYDQIEFYGTIHNKSTGSSYDRFMNLGLKIGDIISVEYTNDVMPYVTKPDCEHNRNNPNPMEPFITKCPICGSKLEISSSGKTIYCPNELCEGRITARLSNMMQKLNLKDFSTERLMAIKKEHLYELLELTYDDVEFLGPTIAQNFIDRMTAIKTTPIYDYEIVGALGFTGIAKKKWQLIFSFVPLRSFYALWKDNALSFLAQTIKGIGKSIVDTIDKEMEYFEKDILYIINKMPNIMDSIGVGQAKSIRCSGFRNPELMNHLRSLGYDADDNGTVTKRTDILLVPFEDYTSTKTKKAGPNTIIVTVDEFTANMSKYLQ